MLSTLSNGFACSQVLHCGEAALFEMWGIPDPAMPEPVSHRHRHRHSDSTAALTEHTVSSLRELQK